MSGRPEAVKVPSSYRQCSIQLAANFNQLQSKLQLPAMHTSSDRDE